MRYLSAAEIEEIQTLRADNCRIKDIARKFGVCQETVFHHVSGKTALRGVRKWRPEPKTIPKPVKIVAPVTQEVVFKSLPDTVLFEHVRECNFIG